VNGEENLTLRLRAIWEPGGSARAEVDILDGHGDRLLVRVIEAAGTWVRPVPQWPVWARKGAVRMEEIPPAEPIGTVGLQDEGQTGGTGKDACPT